MQNCSSCGHQLSEDSVFCNMCGTKLGIPEIAVESRITKPNKKLIISIVGGLLIIVVFIFIFVFNSNPVKKFIDEIQQYQYADAIETYNNEIKGNTEKENETNTLLKQEIEGVKNDFIAEKIDFDSSINFLDTVEKTELLKSEVKLAREEIAKLNDSRTAFKTGQELLNNEKIKDGITELKRVIKADQNYSKAQSLIEESKTQYKLLMLKDAEQLASEEKYDEAMAVLVEALKMIPDDSDMSAKKAVYEKENEEKIAAERKIKMADAEKNQEIIVTNTKIVIQSTEYKVLYPDMIQVILQNKSEKTVKNMEVSILAYDSNDLPVKILTKYNFSGGDYELIGHAENVNIVPEATFGSNNGWPLDQNHGIDKVIACVKSAEYYDGSTWENPYYEYWLEEYAEKPLH